MFNRWKHILDSPYPPMMLLRLVVMISLVSANFLKPHANIVLNTLAILFFIVGYFCLRNVKKRLWIFFVMELFLSILIGFYSLGTNFPYQLLVGQVGLGLFLYYEGKVLYISWSLFFVLLIISELLFDLHEVAQILINHSFIVFASLTGGFIRHSYQMKNRFRQLYQELSTSYQKLQEHAQTVEQLAMEEERNRIAREIHDTVGHTVTALIFQLEAARKLMGKDRQKSYDIMKTTEELARSIYQEIRFSIETNYQDAWEDLEMNTLLKQLMNDFSRLTQLEFNYQIKGEIPAWLSCKHKFSLYRILQETLTNAKRHGLAKEVWITLVFDDHDVEFIIEDNGVGTDQLQLGFGLENLQSRVEDLGGTCQFDTSKGRGFRTVVLLPLKERGIDG